MASGFRWLKAAAAAGIGAMVLLSGRAGVCSEPVSAESSEEACFSMNRRLGRGVNILGYDPIWRSREQGRFKDRYFRMLREGGFHSVRINLHPFHFMSDEPPHTLSSEWLGTLHWAVDQSLAAGLAVVLDLHEYNAMGSDAEGHRGKFLAFWEQMSREFADAPDSVLFEILNEPNGDLTESVWNAYYRQALAIIRKSHPRRIVVVGPAHYNSVGALDGLELPAEDRHLIVTVHYYTPMEFTHQGAGWTPAYTNVSGVVWPRSPADEEAVAADFQKVQAWAQRQKRPIYLGEFGAYDKADMDSRVRYISFVARTAEKCGFSWAYWQFDSNFILYDVENEKWIQPIYNALIQ